MALDPFAGAASTNDDAKKRLLEAVAAGGTEGRKSYESAQAAVAAAQQEALARAAANSQVNSMGLDTGAAGRISSRFGQHASAIAGAQDAFTKGMAQTQTSGTSYLEKLGATMPLLKEENNLKIGLREKEIQAAIALAQQKAAEEAAEKAAAEQRSITRDNEAEKRTIARETRAEARANAAKAAEFPLKEILGRTQRELPGVTKQADASKLALDELTKNAGIWASGSNLEPLRQEMIKNGKRLDAINQLTKGGLKSGGKILKSLLPGGEKAMWGDKQIKSLKREQDSLVKKQGELVRQMDAIRAYNAGQNKTSSERLGQLQAQYAEAQRLTDPTELSRYLSENVFGRGADETYGNITDSTWQPILNATATKDKKGIAEQSQALFDKVKINGGPKMVQEILNKKDVQETINEAQGGMYENMTWAEAKRVLGDTYLKKGQDRTYRILEELLHDLPWKKEAR